MPLLTDHTRLQPGPDLLTSTLTADEVVILHIGQGTYFSLEHVGAALWHHLATAPFTFAELADFVEVHYEVSSIACRKDLAAFIEGLLTHDLLRLQDP